MVVFGETENLFDVLTYGATYCDDGFIAAIYNSVEVWVAEFNPILTMGDLKY